MLIRLASTACAAGIVTTLLAAAPIMPERGAPRPTLGTAPAGTVEQAPTSSGPSNLPLAPRKLLTKPASKDIELPVNPTTGRPQWNGKLGVKFRDSLKMRAELVPGENLRSSNAAAVQQATDLVKTFGGSIRQMLRKSPEQLRELERRAERYSGTAQPDLAGMMYVDVQPERLLDAARALNDLDIVEWVEIERDPILDGTGNNAEQDGCGQYGPGTGPGVSNCYTASPDSRCSTLGGGNGCNDVAGCNDPNGALPTCRYGCNNTQCCDLVADILPNCDDVGNPTGWDALCATYANILCQSTVYDTNAPIQGQNLPPAGPNSIPLLYKYDPCFAMRGPIDPAETEVLVYGVAETIIVPGGYTPLSGQLLTYDAGPDPVTGAPFVSGTLEYVQYPNPDIEDEADPTTDVPQAALPDPSLEGAFLAISAGCFSEHGFGGCNQVSCCVYVCRTDPTCCTIAWDADCTALANNAPVGTLSPSPCTGQSLDPAAFPPSAPVSPLLTAGLSATSGDVRGYQNYTSGRPVLGPFTTLPAGVTYPVIPPTVNTEVTPDPTRINVDSNLGTFATINSGYRGGGFDLEGYSTLVTQLGINPITRAFGQRFRVAVIEFSAYVNHEDIVNKVYAEEGQTQVLIIEDPLDPNHGTACLGIIGAERNDIGMTGIAWGAGLSFYPTVSREEGTRLPNALTSALIDLSEGDVISMSIGFGGGNTIVTSPAVFELVRVGTSAGILSCCSAGNDAAPVRTSPDGATDSGAVIVGACWPGFQVGQLTNAISVPGPFPGNNYCRLNFSNFTDLDNPGNEVDVSAWGTGVGSIGYGDLYNGDNQPVDDPLELNKLRSYTSQFNGTSAAAPQIAGWAACIQSLALNWWGTPLPPTVLRGLMRNNVQPQCGLDYDNPFFPGYPEQGDPFVGDIEPGGEQARIRGFPNCRATVADVVANTFGGTPIDATVITGVLQAGDSFAIRQLDGAFLRLGPARKRAGNSGQGYGAPLFYPLSGGTTDVQLSVTSLQGPDSVSAIFMQVASAVSIPLPTVEVVYFYNFTQQRWVSAGTSVLGSDAVVTGFAPPGSLDDYVVGTSTGGSAVYARVYTCTLSPSGAFSILHDLLGLQITVDIFNP